MLFNHIKTAFRSLVKQKSFTFINISGLAIGLAGCLLILQFVSFEMSYDSFHEHADDIFRVSYSKEKDGVESFHTVLSYVGVGPALQQNFPEVLDYARLRPAATLNASTVLTVDNEAFEETRVYYADPGFLRMFSFNLLQGNPETALNRQFTAVITESTAKRYYGNENPLGKSFRRGRNQEYVVTGVIEDTPLNAHLKFDFLLSHETLSAISNNYSPTNMTSFHGHLYIRTQPGTTAAQLSAKFPQFVDDFIWSVQNQPEGTELFLYSMPLKDIHLHSNIQHEAEVNGDESIVTYLTIIAAMILLIAWVNYINLSTARAARRAREVGVRKVLGSLKGHLIWQFMVESAIMNLLSVLVALGIVFISQSLFVQFGAAEMLSIKPWRNAQFWQVVFLLWAFGTLISGVYPALTLSSYKPLSVLRGSFYGNKRGIFLRKVLVVFQFTASVALLIGTAVVFLQIGHMRNKDLGINIDHAIALRAPVLADSTYDSRIRNFKTELKRNPRIENVVAASDVPGREVNGATWFRRINQRREEGIFCLQSRADQDFVAAMEVQLLAGRNFNAEDRGQSIFINEEARKQFGFDSAEEAVNKEITFASGNGDYRMTIVGVLDNYHQLSPKVDHTPLITRYDPFVRRYYMIKFNTGTDPGAAVREVIATAEDTYKSLFPGNPFSYFFIDEEFEKQYEADQQFGDMFGIFSLLAIFVACLGLFGLAAHTVIQKTKEIGIRKVLGSSIPNILRHLSWEYIKLIILSNVLAWPLIYYLMNEWLDSFVDRIAINLWLFPAACLLVTFIALFTVSFHTIKAARANPVNSLRYE
jgi:putative ABC transport system permease protein